jgi:hypothetical protein
MESIRLYLRLFVDGILCHLSCRVFRSVSYANTVTMTMTTVSRDK